ncbi:hypothetical protein NOS3756_18740 [Nostoc sp. NIES-3756]|nr:hypothetical protein NOS3756_18740 [Nostoc sp. NIES-3756]
MGSIQAFTCLDLCDCGYKSTVQAATQTKPACVG